MPGGWQSSLPGSGSCAGRPRSPASDDDEQRMQMEIQRGRSYLHDLAEAGGTLYAADGMDSLGGAFGKLRRSSTASITWATFPQTRRRMESSGS
jgi:hypothetical protein